LATAYSSLSPALNTAAAVCRVNGQEVACPQFLNFLGPAIPLVFLAVIIIVIAGAWRIFTKAGQPGWAAIIPIYNMVVMLQVVRKPIWWVILAFIPIVNIIVGFIVAYELARVFGKGFGFTLGLIILPIIFYPILGFGKAAYMPGNQMQVPAPQI
jgi:hypothetical protein